MKIRINRLDYKSQGENGLKTLPQLTSLDQINDLSEVVSINIYGDKDELEALKSKMPKSHKWQINPWTDGANKGYFMWVKFNTFSTNKTTGDKNESAIIRRKRVVSKLKSVM